MLQVKKTVGFRLEFGERDLLSTVVGRLVGDS
jgi:hypothetical protein